MKTFKKYSEPKHLQVDSVKNISICHAFMEF